MKVSAQFVFEGRGWEWKCELCVVEESGGF